MPVLVIDADITPRLAAELVKRGRDSRSLQSLGLKEEKDPSLLHMLNAEFGVHGYVLVTGDDQMPFAHFGLPLWSQPATLDATPERRPACQTRKRSGSLTRPRRLPAVPRFRCRRSAMYWRR